MELSHYQRGSRRAQSTSLPRSFRSKLLWIITGLIILILTFKGSPGAHRFLPSSRNRIASSLSTKWRETTIQTPFTPSQASANHEHSLHIILTSSQRRSASTCRTVFSASALGYPPMTIVEYKAEENGQMQRISAVNKFLKETRNINEGDVVLVVQPDTWFQLPAKIVVDRSFELLQDSSSSLRKTYGTTVVGNATKPRFTQTLLFGADKRCSSNDFDDLACAAVPYSTLPSDSISFSTNPDSSYHNSHPRWLNSGTVLGQADHVVSLFDYANERVAEDRIMSQSSSPFASIFGEQEYMREVARQNNTNGWLDWLASKMSLYAKSPNITNLHLDVVGGREYEYGIGVDYESELIQVVEQANNNVKWLLVDDSISVSGGSEEKVTFPEKINLPPDVRRLRSPFEGHEYNGQPGLLDHVTWPHLPVAMNLQTVSVSPLLQIDATKEADVQRMWRNMWFQPYANFLTQAQREKGAKTEVVPATTSHERIAWESSAEMGVWTMEGRWLPWAEFCRDYEKDVF